MIQELAKAALDAPIADMERRWKESGIPGLYEGRNGPVSRERANNIRALLYPKPKLPAGSITRSSIPGPAGEVPVRIVRPVEGEPVGTLVYFHGGGFVLGSVDSHEAHAIRLANRARVVVVNVEYRLAPEDGFPAGIEDAWAATQWAHAHRATLGGADRPLAVGGDSAGGNFAAVMALLCRDAAIALGAQLLIYPATNLTGADDSDVHVAYFGRNAGILSQDFRASPALAASHSGLAPAILGVGSHDFLYQDNLAYARILEAAGVPLTLRQWDNLNHGFFSYTAISAPSLAAADQLCDDLHALLTGQAPAP